MRVHASADVLLPGGEDAAVCRSNILVLQPDGDPVRQRTSPQAQATFGVCVMGSFLMADRVRREGTAALDGIPPEPDCGCV
jgi:hypothetical protein